MPEPGAGAVVPWWQGLLTTLALHPLPLFWYWLTGPHSWLYQLYRNIKSGFDPRYRRRRRLLSWVGQAAGRTVPDLATVWTDGSVICDVIHNSCPSTNSGHEGWDDCRDTFRHAQALAYRCLLLQPAFSELELNRPELTPANERRLFRYLQSLRTAVSKQELDRSRSADDDSDCEVHVAVEYIARGMGLIMASRNQRAIFYVYSRDGGSLMNIHIEIRGPGEDFGSVLVTNSDNVNQRDCSIIMEYRLTDEYLRVSYQPRSVGHHELTISRYGYVIPGSPFLVSVDEISETLPKKRFNSIEWFSEDEERRQYIIQKKKKNAKVKCRIVDFVTEKMYLTDDGKLINMPQENTPEYNSTATPVIYPANKIESIENLQSGEPFSLFNCDSRNLPRLRRSISPRMKSKRQDKSKLAYIRPDAARYLVFRPRNVEAKTVSDAAAQVTLAYQQNIFQEKCRRIVMVCDYLLRHCPREKSLDIISGAGHILQSDKINNNVLCENSPVDQNITKELTECGSDVDDDVFIPSAIQSPTVRTITNPERRRSVSLCVNDENASGKEIEGKEDTFKEKKGGTRRLSEASASVARANFRIEGNTKSPKRNSSFASISSNKISNEDEAEENTQLSTELLNLEENLIIKCHIDYTAETNKLFLRCNSTDDEAIEPILGNCMESESISNNKCINNTINGYEHHKTQDHQCNTLLPSTEHNHDSIVISNQSELDELKHKSKVSVRLTGPRGSIVGNIVNQFESGCIQKGKEDADITLTQPVNGSFSANFKNIKSDTTYSLSSHQNKQNTNVFCDDSHISHIEYLKSIGATDESLSMIRSKVNKCHNTHFDKTKRLNDMHLVSNTIEKRRSENKYAIPDVFRAEPAIVVYRHYSELQSNINVNNKIVPSNVKCSINDLVSTQHKVIEAVESSERRIVKREVLSDDDQKDNIIVQTIDEDVVPDIENYCSECITGNHLHHNNEGNNAIFKDKKISLSNMENSLTNKECSKLDEIMICTLNEPRTNFNKNISTQATKLNSHHQDGENYDTVNQRNVCIADDKVIPLSDKANSLTYKECLNADIKRIFPYEKLGNHSLGRISTLDKIVDEEITHHKENGSINKGKHSITNEEIIQMSDKENAITNKEGSNVEKEYDFTLNESGKHSINDISTLHEISNAREAVCSLEYNFLKYSLGKGDDKPSNGKVPQDLVKCTGDSFILADDKKIKAVDEHKHAKEKENNGKNSISDDIIFPISENEYSLPNEESSNVVKQNDIIFNELVNNSLNGIATLDPKLEKQEDGAVLSIEDKCWECSPGDDVPGNSIISQNPVKYADDSIILADDTKFKAVGENEHSKDEKNNVIDNGKNSIADEGIILMSDEECSLRNEECLNVDKQNFFLLDALGNPSINSITTLDQTLDKYEVKTMRILEKKCSEDSPSNIEDIQRNSIVTETPVNFAEDILEVGNDSKEVEEDIYLKGEGNNEIDKPNHLNIINDKIFSLPDMEVSFANKKSLKNVDKQHDFTLSASGEHSVYDVTMLHTILEIHEAGCVSSLGNKCLEDYLGKEEDIPSNNIVTRNPFNYTGELNCCVGSLEHKCLEDLPKNEDMLRCTITENNYFEFTTFNAEKRHHKEKENDGIANKIRSIADEEIISMCNEEYSSNETSIFTINESGNHFVSRESTLDKLLDEEETETVCTLENKCPDDRSGNEGNIPCNSTLTENKVTYVDNLIILPGNEKSEAIVKFKHQEKNDDIDIEKHSIVHEKIISMSDEEIASTNEECSNTGRNYYFKLNESRKHSVDDISTLDEILNPHEAVCSYKNQCRMEDSLVNESKIPSNSIIDQDPVKYTHDSINLSEYKICEPIDEHIHSKGEENNVIDHSKNSISNEEMVPMSDDEKVLTKEECLIVDEQYDPIVNEYKRQLIDCTTTTLDTILDNYDEETVHSIDNKCLKDLLGNEENIPSNNIVTYTDDSLAGDEICKIVHKFIHHKEGEIYNTVNGMNSIADDKIVLMSSEKNASKNKECSKVDIHSKFREENILSNVTVTKTPVNYAGNSIIVAGDKISEAIDKLVDSKEAEKDDIDNGNNSIVNDKIIKRPEEHNALTNEEFSNVDKHYDSILNELGNCCQGTVHSLDNKCKEDSSGNEEEIPRNSGLTQNSTCSEFAICSSVNDQVYQTEEKNYNIAKGKNLISDAKIFPVSHKENSLTNEECSKVDKQYDSILNELENHSLGGTTTLNTTLENDAVNTSQSSDNKCTEDSPGNEEDIESNSGMTQNSTCSEFTICSSVDDQVYHRKEENNYIDNNKYIDNAKTFPVLEELSNNVDKQYDSIAKKLGNHSLGGTTTRNTTLENDAVNTSQSLYNKCREDFSGNEEDIPSNSGMTQNCTCSEVVICSSVNDQVYHKEENIYIDKGKNLITEAKIFHESDEKNSLTNEECSNVGKQYDSILNELENHSLGGTTTRNTTLENDAVNTSQSLYNKCREDFSGNEEDIPSNSGMTQNSTCSEFTMCSSVNDQVYHREDENNYIANNKCIDDAKIFLLLEEENSLTNETYLNVDKQYHSIPNELENHSLGGTTTQNTIIENITVNTSQRADNNCTKDPSGNEEIMPSNSGMTQNSTCSEFTKCSSVDDQVYHREEENNYIDKGKNLIADAKIFLVSDKENSFTNEECSDVNQKYDTILNELENHSLSGTTTQNITLENNTVNTLHSIDNKWTEDSSDNEENMPSNSGITQNCTCSEVVICSSVDDQVYYKEENIYIDKGKNLITEAKIFPVSDEENSLTNETYLNVDKQYDSILNELENHSLGGTTTQNTTLENFTVNTSLSSDNKCTEDSSGNKENMPSNSSMTQNSTCFEFTICSSVDNQVFHREEDNNYIDKGKNLISDAKIFHVLEEESSLINQECSKVNKQHDYVLNELEYHSLVDTTTRNTTLENDAVNTLQSLDNTCTENCSGNKEDIPSNSGMTQNSTCSEFTICSSVDNQVYHREDENNYIDNNKCIDDAKIFLVLEEENFLTNETYLNVNKQYHSILNELENHSLGGTTTLNTTIENITVKTSQSADNKCTKDPLGNKEIMPSNSGMTQNSTFSEFTIFSSVDDQVYHREAENNYIDKGKNLIPEAKILPVLEEENSLINQECSKVDKQYDSILNELENHSLGGTTTQNTTLENFSVNTSQSSDNKCTEDSPGNEEDIGSNSGMTQNSTCSEFTICNSVDEHVYHREEENNYIDNNKYIDDAKIFPVLEELSNVDKQYDSIANELENHSLRGNTTRNTTLENNAVNTLQSLYNKCMEDFSCNEEDIPSNSGMTQNCTCSEVVICSSVDDQVYHKDENNYIDKGKNLITDAKIFPVSEEENSSTNEECSNVDKQYDSIDNELENHSLGGTTTQNTTLEHFTVNTLLSSDNKCTEDSSGNKENMSSNSSTTQNSTCSEFTICSSAEIQVFHREENNYIDKGKNLIADAKIFPVLEEESSLINQECSKVNKQHDYVLNELEYHSLGGTTTRNTTLENDAVNTLQSLDNKCTENSSGNEEDIPCNSGMTQNSTCSEFTMCSLVDDQVYHREEENNYIDNNKFIDDAKIFLMLEEVNSLTNETCLNVGKQYDSILNELDNHSLDGTTTKNTRLENNTVNTLQSIDNKWMESSSGNEENMPSNSGMAQNSTCSEFTICSSVDDQVYHREEENNYIEKGKSLIADAKIFPLSDEENSLTNQECLNVDKQYDSILNELENHSQGGTTTRNATLENDAVNTLQSLDIKWMEDSWGNKENMPSNSGMTRNSTCSEFTRNSIDKQEHHIEEDDKYVDKGQNLIADNKIFPMSDEECIMGNKECSNVSNQNYAVLNELENHCPDGTITMGTLLFQTYELKTANNLENKCLGDSLDNVEDILRNSNSTQCSHNSEFTIFNEDDEQVHHIEDLDGIIIQMTDKGNSLTNKEWSNEDEKSTTNKSGNDSFDRISTADKILDIHKAVTVSTLKKKCLEDSLGNKYNVPSNSIVSQNSIQYIDDSFSLADEKICKAFHEYIHNEDEYHNYNDNGMNSISNDEIIPISGEENVLNEEANKERLNVDHQYDFTLNESVNHLTDGISTLDTILEKDEVVTVRIFENICLEGSPSNVVHLPTNSVVTQTTGNYAEDSIILAKNKTCSEVNEDRHTIEEENYDMDRRKNLTINDKIFSMSDEGISLANEESLNVDKQYNLTLSKSGEHSLDGISTLDTWKQEAYVPSVENKCSDSQGNGEDKPTHSIYTQNPFKYTEDTNILATDKICKAIDELVHSKKEETNGIIDGKSSVADENIIPYSNDDNLLINKEYLILNEQSTFTFNTSENHSMESVDGLDRKIHKLLAETVCDLECNSAEDLRVEKNNLPSNLLVIQNPVTNKDDSIILAEDPIHKAVQEQIHCNEHENCNINENNSNNHDNMIPMSFNECFITNKQCSKVEEQGIFLFNKLVNYTMDDIGTQDTILDTLGPVTVPNLENKYSEDMQDNKDHILNINTITQDKEQDNYIEKVKTTRANEKRILIKIEENSTKEESPKVDNHCTFAPIEMKDHSFHAIITAESHIITKTLGAERASSLENIRLDKFTGNAEDVLSKTVVNTMAVKGVSSFDTDSQASTTAASEADPLNSNVSLLPCSSEDMVFIKNGSQELKKENIEPSVENKERVLVNAFVNNNPADYADDSTIIRTDTFICTEAEEDTDMNLNKYKLFTPSNESNIEFDSIICTNYTTMQNLPRKTTSLTVEKQVDFINSIGIRYDDTNSKNTQGRETELCEGSSRYNDNDAVIIKENSLQYLERKQGIAGQLGDEWSYNTVMLKDILKSDSEVKKLDENIHTNLDNNLDLNTAQEIPNLSESYKNDVNCHIIIGKSLQCTPEDTFNSIYTKLNEFIQNTETYNNFLCTRENEKMILESETLNINLLHLEQELSEVLSIEDEEMDKNVNTEIDNIDAMEPPEINLIETEPKVDRSPVYLEHIQSYKVNENDTLDHSIGNNMSDVAGIPDSDINIIDCYQSKKQPKKLLRVDSLLFKFISNDGEECCLEDETLDVTIINEVNEIDTLTEIELSENIGFLNNSTQERKPTNINLPPIKNCHINTAIIEGEELDHEIQQELNEIKIFKFNEEALLGEEGITEPMVIANSDGEPLDEYTSSIRKLLKFNLYDIDGNAKGVDEEDYVDDECQLNESCIALENTTVQSTSDSGVILNHDMGNYNLFKTSLIFDDFPKSEIDYASLDINCPDLDAGEAFIDNFEVFDKNIIAVEAKTSEFHMWSSNVEFGVPGDTHNSKNDIDFDSIIFAPNLNEALKKLETRIHDTQEEFQLLGKRTPSPSIQLFEQYLIEESVLHNEHDKSQSDEIVADTESDQGYCVDNDLVLWALPCKNLEKCDVINSVDTQVILEEPHGIISPYQYPRVLLENAGQMSIIDEEEDLKSEATSFTTTQHGNTLQSSESILSGEYNQYLELRSSADEDYDREENMVRGRFNCLITNLSVDSDLKSEQSSSNHDLRFDHYSISNPTTKNTNIKSLTNDVDNYYIGKNNCNSYSCHKEHCNEGHKDSYLYETDNYCEQKMDTAENKISTSSEKNNIDSKLGSKQWHIRDGIKELLHNNIDLIPEDIIGELTVSERKAYWDKKLQRIQEVENGITSTSSSRYTPKIKSGTVHQLVSCFISPNEETSAPLDYLAKQTYNLRNTSVYPKVAIEQTKTALTGSNLKESDRDAMFQSPVSEINLDDTSTLKLVSHWKSYWNDMINEHHDEPTCKLARYGDAYRLPPIEVSVDKESCSEMKNNTYDSNSSVSIHSETMVDERDLKYEDKYYENVQEGEGLVSIVLQNIKAFSTNDNNSYPKKYVHNNLSDCVPVNDTGIAIKEFNITEKQSSNGFTQRNELECLNLTESEIKSVAEKVEFERGNMDKTNDSNNIIDKVEKLNDFKLRFERAKQFFKHLEQSGPGDVKGREFRSMPRLNFHATTGKPSVDSDSGTEVKPQTKIHRHRCKRKKRKTSGKIRSAPTSDTETSKRVIYSDSFDSFGGSVKSIKVSERFHIKDLFRDVSGEDGSFKGIPNRAAVLASLRSVDDDRAISPYHIDYDTLTSSSSLGNIPSGFQKEYPYLPTTPICQFRPRSALEFNLISRCELLDQQF